MVATLADPPCSLSQHLDLRRACPNNIRHCQEDPPRWFPPWGITGAFVL